jgi:hypothetical protein
VRSKGLQLIERLGDKNIFEFLARFVTQKWEARKDLPIHTVSHGNLKSKDKSPMLNRVTSFDLQATATRDPDIVLAVCNRYALGRRDG